MKNVVLALVGVFVLVCAVASTQITILSVPPIGAVPEGRTLIVSRLSNMTFIDSPDAMCERAQGGVSLLCRGIALATVAGKATIYLRLPYSSFLYEISTGGKTYSK